MKRFVQPKVLRIVFWMFLIAILISTIIVSYKFQAGALIAQAGDLDNVDGWAWNPHFGWISMNCTNEDPPCGNDYGININPTTGDFSGYAWSSNIGWIYFGPDDIDLGIYAADAPEDPKQWAKYDSNAGDDVPNVTGWAKILSLGDNGWLKMSGAWDNGVIIDADGNFSRYAWNGNDDGTGIGWVSFNGTGYQVKYEVPVPATPDIGNIVDLPNTCKWVMVNWTDKSDNETGFEVEIKTEGGVWSYFCSVDIENIESCSALGLSPSTQYYFRVRAVNEAGASDWSPNENGQGHVTSICAPTAEEPLNYNCDRVEIKWAQPGGDQDVDHYKIERNKNEEDWIVIADPEYGFSYIDEDIESGAKYIYKIIAVDSEGVEFPSEEADEIFPCPDLPTWQEVR